MVADEIINLNIHNTLINNGINMSIDDISEKIMVLENT